MPVQSLQKKGYQILPGWSTYGAVVPSQTGTVYTSERSRSWSRMFRTRKAMYQFLLQNGFLPTLHYEDRTSDIVNSRVVTFTGKLTADPASDFSWSIIPSSNRYIVDQSDNWLPALKASVTAQLQSRISGNGTNLYVSAAEAKSTVGMIGDCVARVAKAYTEVRHGRFGAAAKTLGLGKVPRGVSRRQAVANNWLEYRYGWRLLVKDIVSLMETLHDSLSNRPPILRVTAKAERVGSYNWSYGGSLQLPNGLWLCTYTENKATTFHADVRGGYLYSLSSVPLATGQSFGLTNPFLVAWELIPFSFVFDWIVNVGSVLEGLTAFQGKAYIDGWMCSKIQSTTSYTWTNVTKSSDIRTLDKTGPIELGPAICRDFVRDKVGFTPASLRVEVDLNVPRVLDAISLLGQVTGLLGGSGRKHSMR